MAYLYLPRDGWDDASVRVPSLTSMARTAVDASAVRNVACGGGAHRGAPAATLTAARPGVDDARPAPVAASPDEGPAGLRAGAWVP